MSQAASLQFTGAYQDPVASGYPLGNGYRWYLIALMRFNAPDDWSPFGDGGVNPYVYCAGDPINRSDPGGHVWRPISQEFLEELVLLQREQDEFREQNIQAGWQARASTPEVHLVDDAPIAAAHVSHAAAPAASSHAALPTTTSRAGVVSLPAGEEGAGPSTSVAAQAHSAPLPVPHVPPAPQSLDFDEVWHASFARRTLSDNDIRTRLGVGWNQDFSAQGNLLAFVDELQHRGLRYTDLHYRPTYKDLSTELGFKWDYLPHLHSRYKRGSVRGQTSRQAFYTILGQLGYDPLPPP